MKTEITQIKVQLKDRSVMLSTKEARELYDELGKLFAIGTVTREIYHHPIIIDRSVPLWPRWEVTCGSAGNLVNGLLCMNVGSAE